VAVNVFSTRGDTTTAEIWVDDLSTGTFTALSSLGNVVSPEWTPDGKRIVFTTWFEKKPTIWWQVADGSQPPEKILELSDGEVVHSANPTPDGGGILFCKVTNLLGKSDLFYLPLTGEKKPERITGPFGFGCDGRLSPDGRWLAYVSTEDAKPKVYVRPFRAAGSPVLVSPQSGDSPRWSRDGSRLYYRQVDAALGRGSLYFARVGSSGGGVRVQNPERVAALQEGGVYDISPDRTHAVMLSEAEGRVQLVVTANWIAQLQARMEENK
jgi:Tol biopolymer transport system component